MKGIQGWRDAGFRREAPQRGFPPGFLSSRPDGALIHYHFTLMALGDGRLLIPYSCQSFVVWEGVGDSVCLPFFPLSAIAVSSRSTSRTTSPTIDRLYFYSSSQMGGRDDSLPLM